MELTVWTLEGDDEAIREIQGRRFASGDSGDAVYCTMVCKDLGRHVHIDYCRSPQNVSDCNHPEVRHINEILEPNPGRPKDWTTHALFWARSGKCFSLKSHFKSYVPELTLRAKASKTYTLLPNKKILPNGASSS